MQNTSHIAEKIEAKYHVKKRKSLSLRFPFLVPVIIAVRGLERRVRDRRAKLSRDVVTFGDSAAQYKVLVRHSSPLLRKLGDDPSNEALQQSKVKNLQLASLALDGLVIRSGETFSLWEALGGAPTRKKGYQEGILLSGGKVVPGVGGGLCQLSNLLYWMTLHTELSVVERHHHSLDVFKDSGRTIPFGTGATIFFPVLDLRFTNTYKEDIIISIGVTEAQLVAKFLIKEKESSDKYHIYSTDDAYYRYKGEFYRYNKIYREVLRDGVSVKNEFLYENLFPTLYVPDDFIDLC